MEVDAVGLLRELNISIAAGTSRHSWQLRPSGSDAFLVQPVRPVEHLTAHSVRNVKADRLERSRPLFVGRTATPGIMGRANAGELDVLIEEPLQLIHQGVVFAVEEYVHTAQALSRSRRPAWIRRAVERCLLLVDRPLSQPSIADLVGTSQQSVSAACRELRPMVSSTKQGVMVHDPKALLEHWVREYTGPGGQEFGWYSIDSVVEQTVKAAEVASLLEAQPLISGDVAADRLAPWKLPARGRIYIDIPVDLAGDGFVAAPLDEATLITCTPLDPTLWRLTDLGASPGHDNVKLADPAIVYWDVHNSDDIDSLEAAHHLGAFITGLL